VSATSVTPGMAHSPGGRKVAGSNPVAPTTNQGGVARRSGSAAPSRHDSDAVLLGRCLRKRRGEEALHLVERLSALLCSAQDESAFHRCKEDGGIVVRG
jgi:hypothetical protein